MERLPSKRLTRFSTAKEKPLIFARKSGVYLVEPGGWSTVSLFPSASR